MGVDHQQYAIDHFHNAFDFAAEIGMARRVHDIDAIAIPLKRGIFGANGDALFAFKIHRIHDALLDFLIGAERPGLPQQLIYQRGLAVINVRNDAEVTDLIHGGRALQSSSSGSRITAAGCRGGRLHAVK